LWRIQNKNLKIRTINYTDCPLLKRYGANPFLVPEFVKIPHPVTILLSATAFDELKTLKQREKNFYLDHVSDIRVEMYIQFDADKEDKNHNKAKNIDLQYIFVESAANQ